MFKKVFTMFSIFFISYGFSQGMFNLFGSDNVIKDDWQIGAGADLVRYSDSDWNYVKDKHSLQLPRFNVVRKLNKTFSVGADFSISGFDSVFGLVTNEFSYFSFDGSLRYNYFTANRLRPYLLLGLSYVDIRRSLSPTINIGTGLTFWLTSSIGVNTQFIYKNALQKERMVTHMQLCGGLVFAISQDKRINMSRCSFEM